MKMLSIDPSSSSPGLAFFKDGAPWNCYTSKYKGDSLIERMKNFLNDLQMILNVEVFDYIAIESPYLGLSKSTSMKMGQIFGMIEGCLLMFGYDPQEIIEIHPMTAKKAAGVGYFKDREEGKITVLEHMREKFPDLQITDDNSSDALAIGLAAVKEIYEREANKVS